MQYRRCAAQNAAVARFERSHARPGGGLDSDGSLSAKGMKPKETEQKQRLVRFTDLFKKKRRCCFLTFPIDTQ